jgi:hypothetical protein
MVTNKLSNTLDHASNKITISVSSFNPSNYTSSFSAYRSTYS